MPPETTGSAQTTHRIGTTVVFTSGTYSHQIWTSQATGRIVEVQPNASWLPTVLLVPGDLGELFYREARPVVARINVRAAPSSDPTDARGWVRHALAELGSDVNHEALEAAAVVPMRTQTPDATAVRAGSLAIAVLCTSLERHRRAMG